jgi:hypothetical protein
MKPRLNDYSRSLAAFGLGCLFLLFVVNTVPAQGPPVGSWDFVLTGSERGVAQIFFHEDGRLDGRMVFAAFGRSTNNFATNFYGGAAIIGQWSYVKPTAPNRILGVINRVSGLAGTTALETNGLSFRGTVRESKMNLRGFGDQGRVTFTGIPLAGANDLSGTYYGSGQRQAAAGFVEIFELGHPPSIDYVTNITVTASDCSVTNDLVTTNSGTITHTVTIIQQTCYVTNVIVRPVINDFVDNYYDVVGGGPGYNYAGRLLVSQQKFAAFYQSRGAEFLTVYTGRFDPVMGRGTLIGTDGVNRGIRLTIRPGGP